MKKINISKKSYTIKKKPAPKKEEVASYDPNDMMSALAALKGKFKK